MPASRIVCFIIMCVPKVLTTLYCGRVQASRVFWWMFGGDEEALRPGRPVTAIVRKVTRDFAFCSIPELGNRDATLSIEDISTSTLATCDERLQDGQRIEARCVAGLRV